MNLWDGWAILLIPPLVGQAGLILSIDKCTYMDTYIGLLYISKAIVLTRAPAPGTAVKTVLLLIDAGETDLGRELQFVPGVGSPERTVPGSHQQ